MATRFAFDVDLGGGRAVLRLRGELDLTGAPLLRTCLHGLVDSVERDVVIDVGDLAYIDASGIRAIAREARRLRDKGGTMTVVAPRPLTRRLFDLLDISQLVQIVDGPDGAPAPAPMPSADGKPAARAKPR